MMLARSRSLARVDHVGRARRLRRPCACRADRRGGTRSRARRCRAASRRRRDRARRRRPLDARHRARSASRLENRSSISVSRPPACSTRSAPERDRGLIAVDADHLAIGGRKNGARIAAGAEGAVDIDAAVADVEEFDGVAAEHGNVEGRSASDSRAAAARHHSRAPGASRAATWEPSCALSARTFWVASASSALETARLPDLKLVTETDERHRVGNPCMALQVLAQDHPALAVDLQCLAGAVERQREPLALFRKRRDSARSTPRSPPSAHSRRHRSPGDPAPDSNRGRRSRRGRAPSETKRGSTRAPWSRAAA